MKSIYSNKSNDIIGFIDIYHGYPNLQTLWISIFVLDRNIQNKGFGQEVIDALTKDAIDTNYSPIPFIYLILLKTIIRKN
ncbi:MAG: GNAT family N-acetyltransferase [Clostridium argentinense]|nr:GNAT family N-acetyltransferase [uncultured Clostridium sp.]MBS5822500.1 GNAT family N-acetyltransferase [Clostridium argentinense]MDU1347939.1 GNAT family N-acetyltransferase [Clostridium argentinense]